MENFYGLKTIGLILLEIFYFPVWWYSKGLMGAFVRAKNFLAKRERGLALLVWIKNIFVPMYGQTDIASRLISFFMRFFQIIFRSVAMLFWVFAVLIIILFYIFLPVFVVYQIIFQIFL